MPGSFPGAGAPTRQPDETAELSGAVCRAHVAESYSAEAMVDGYERISGSLAWS